MENLKKNGIKNLNELDDIKKSTNQRIAIEFINLSGIDIDCWLDANDEIYKKNKNNSLNKFKLEGFGERNKRQILTDELSLYYKQLSEAQSKIKKDKFSFRIKGYIPVYGNDFSASYTSSFRIKKSQIAKDEIRPIYTAMKEKKNQSMISKNENINETVQRTNSRALSELIEEDDDKQSLKNDISETISELNEEEDKERQSKDLFFPKNF